MDRRTFSRGRPWDCAADHHRAEARGDHSVGYGDRRRTRSAPDRGCRGCCGWRRWWRPWSSSCGSNGPVDVAPGEVSYGENADADTNVIVCTPGLSGGVTFVRSE